MIVSIIAGCNIFEPREAEEPDKPVGWNPFPTTPERCLENLVFVYNHRENVYQYGSVLSDRFVFHFDPQDRADFTLPASWGKANEIEMLMNAYQQMGQHQEMHLTLMIIPDQPDRIQANSAWIFRYYILFVNHNQSSLGTEFAGKMQLYLERESNGFWRIREWSDFRGQSEWTWGRMKNAFAA